MAEFESGEFDESTSSMRDVFLIDQQPEEERLPELEPEPRPNLKESNIEQEPDEENLPEPEPKPKPNLKESNTVEATNSQSENPTTTDPPILGELVVAPENLIEMMKQQAHHLEQSDYIDGRFYAGMFLGVTAHLAEIVEIGRDAWEEQQDQEAVTKEDFSEEPLASSVQESSQAVADSLSRFVQARASVHDISVDEPIETNLGNLRFTPDEGTITITQDINLARWDEGLQNWEFSDELTDLHKDNVERLLNNQAIDTKGYRILDETIIFEQIQFRAELTDDGWWVTDNSLSADEQQRITRLPQSEAEYVRSVDSKDLLDYFQHRAPEQFVKDVGSIHWKSESESFDRIFEITKQSGRAVVEGFDLAQTDDWGNPRKIFSASIDDEGSIECSQCEIPTADIDYLLAQESQHREDKPEMER